MGIIMDIVLIAIVALNIFLGYKKGLINVVFSLCAFLIALVATIVLVRPVAGLIKDNTNLDENIKQIIIEKKQSEIGNQENTSNDAEKKGLEKYVETYVKDATESAKNEAVQIFANSISDYAINIIAGIIIFLIIRVVLFFLKFIIGGIAKLPIIKQFNEAGGVLYGLLKGILIVYFILAVLFVVVSINETGIITQSINSSYITKFLFQNNILLQIICKKVAI